MSHIYPSTEGIKWDVYDVERWKERWRYREDKTPHAARQMRPYLQANDPIPIWNFTNL